MWLCVSCTRYPAVSAIAVCLIQFWILFRRLLTLQRFTGGVRCVVTLGFVTLTLCFKFVVTKDIRHTPIELCRCDSIGETNCLQDKTSETNMLTCSSDISDRCLWRRLLSALPTRPLVVRGFRLKTTLSLKSSVVAVNVGFKSDSCLHPEHMLYLR